MCGSGSKRRSAFANMSRPRKWLNLGRDADPDCHEQVVLTLICLLSMVPTVSSTCDGPVVRDLMEQGEVPNRSLQGKVSRCIPVPSTRSREPSASLGNHSGICGASFDRYSAPQRRLRHQDTAWEVSYSKSCVVILHDDVVHSRAVDSTSCYSPAASFCAVPQDLLVACRLRAECES